MGVATLAKVKEYLEIDSGVTTNDARLTSLLTRVQAIAEEFCGRKFDEATFTEFFDGGDESGSLILLNYPVRSVTSIHDDIAREYGAGSLISSSTYSILKYQGIVRLDPGLIFVKGNQNVKVVYVAGYGGAGDGATAVPGALEDTIIMGVAEKFEERKNIGVDSKSLASGGTSTYRHGLSEQFYRQLEPFRARRVA